MRQQQLQARRLVRGRPQHVLGAWQVGVGTTLEQQGHDIRSPRGDGVEKHRLALAVLGIWIRSAGEQHVDQCLGRLLAHRLDEERAAIRRGLPRVAPVHEQQVCKAHVVGDGGHSQR